MRRFAIAAVLMSASLACAAAQSLPAERFDRGGLPARAQTDEERDLIRRMSTHRQGDVADAVEIQRKLADYYRGKGDLDRARAAAALATPVAGAGAGPMRDRPYGPVQAPQRGGVPLSAPGSIMAPISGVPVPARTRAGGDAGDPAYGSVPLPGYGPVRSPRPGEAEAPTYGPPVPLPADSPKTSIPLYGNEGPPSAVTADIPVYQPATAAGDPHTGAGTNQQPVSGPPAPPAEQPAPAPLPDANPAAIAQPPALSGRFFMLQGQTLHTWEFRPDGTFEHAWAPRGASTGVGNVEAGAFRVVGPYVLLTILRGSTGPSGAGAGSRGRLTGRSAGAGPEVRRMMLQARGPGGRDGITLDGMMLKPADQ